MLINLMPYSNIIILTGAGISAESGVPTFRATDGLWAGRRVEEVATATALHRDPWGVNTFYNERWAQLATVQPNAAHHALAKLNVLVITQNVDDLHERAGQQDLIHMHGELQKVRCQECGGIAQRPGLITALSACSHCGAVGHMRPHIVLFEEIPFEMEAIERSLTACDLFVSIGTSGHVYPAAGFVRAVRQYANAHTIEINPADTEIAPWFHEHRRGPATLEVPKLVAEIMNTA